MKRRTFFILLMIPIIVLTSCSATKQPLSRNGFLLGTICSITLYDKKNEKILDKAFERIAELESMVSFNENGTELDEINKNAGIKPVKVSVDTYNIIKIGLEHCEMSSGSFDITVGRLVKLWGINSPNAKVPTQREIDEILGYVGYRDLVMNEKEQTVYLKRKGIELDLGGIAKGYIADETAKLLSKNGVKQAIIDLGGNVYVLGSKAKNTDWVIGVQDPFDDRNEIVGTVHFSSKSLVTSGIYERYVEENGKHYHHILSPFDGYPYDNEIAGISIISDLSVDGDALSTSVFSKGLKEGYAYVEKIKGVEAIFVTTDQKVYITKGLEGNFKITNSKYEIKDISTVK